MRKTALLTIDWDAFIPEDVAWDLGHRESEFFINNIWAFRQHLRDKIKLDEDYLDKFWKFFSCLDLSEDFIDIISISDSHLGVLYDDRINHVDTVLLIDAHHDCWSPQDEVDCGSWGAHWLLGNKKRQLTWYRPPYANHDADSIDDAVKSRVVVKNDLVVDADFNDIEIVGMHICRSGCWTPPWLDHEFLKFVSMMNEWFSGQVKLFDLQPKHYSALMVRDIFGSRSD